MSVDNALSDVRKVTVTLPQILIERLDEVVPKRQRSRFIAKAVQEQLAVLEQVVALDETAGIWTDAAYPEMRTEADIDYWLTQLRGSWRQSEMVNE
jgi:metal-responsive CopG/Arc/MetJ family transcriptional regulator